MKENLQIEKQLDLVEAIKANNSLVLKKLYQENYKKVELHILQNNGSVPEAKDTYQEAFITVWKNVKDNKFTPLNETAVQGYLYQIAKNKWTDHLRSAVYKKTDPLLKNMTQKEEIHDFDNNEIDIENIKMNTTMNAFNKLGDDCKNLLLKFYFNKASLREIALEFNVEETSMRNKKYRCIQKLRELIVSPN